MKIIYILLGVLLFSNQLYAQFSIKGKVESSNGLPIEQASIYLSNKGISVQSNKDGYFSIPVSAETVTILINAIGYIRGSWQIEVTEDINRKFILQKDTINLKEVIVHGNDQRAVQMKSSQNTIQINQSYIEENFSGSLMQSLENIPGVKAMSIGSGQSKPIIRGLGFNRMVVAENGIKHEGQQWGEDHGLEIDQFMTDNIEIIKGPGSLLYGSDAIGGVISLRNNYIPIKQSEGKLNFFARSNNESLGISGQFAGRKNNFFYKANITLIDYADYKVPTDSIQYYSYYIKLKDKRLRNTAGKEQNMGLTIGYIKDDFQSSFTASNVYAKSGFFADAHGLEVRLSDIDYDKSSRDIDLPYHSVNHFKLVNNSAWQVGSIRLNGNFAFQNNLRKEFAEPVSHGYMPIPPNTLERKFNKNTFTANLALQVLLADRHNISAGINGEYQDNKRQGWGFIIPDFHTTSLGGYIYDRYHISENLIVSAGMRFDWIDTHIDSYHDWYKTPTENGDSIYKERATNIERAFSSLTWSAGINYSAGQWNLKANIGKSFRAPIAKELGSDGVNYHIFRYEKGEAGLSPEESYQFDAGINWDNGLVNIQISPFFNYFPNYIYLNPTSEYYEGLQMYYYTQSKVVRYGTETEVTYNLSEKIKLNLSGEYLYAKQLSGDKKNYTLPFSPPWSATIGTRYMPKTKWAGTDGFISINYKIVGDQDEIVPPEKKTKGHQTLNMSAGRTCSWKGHTLRFNLQGQNLLNKRYYDHTSYYRLIDVPEPGRNFSLMIGLDF
ncbi:MAG: TonB-dependent receptor [Dysgonomonas sp.]